VSSLGFVCVILARVCPWVCVFWLRLLVCGFSYVALGMCLLVCGAWCVSVYGSSFLGPLLSAFRVRLACRGVGVWGWGGVVEAPHARAHAHSHARTHTHTHMHAHPIESRTCMHACMHQRLTTRTHARTHTRTRTHTHRHTAQ